MKADMFNNRKIVKGLCVFLAVLMAASKAGVCLRKDFIEQRSVVGDNGGRIYIARRGKGYQIRHEISDARRFIGQKSCFVENI